MQNNTQRRVAVLCAAACGSKYAKQHLFIWLIASSQISEGEGGELCYATEAVEYRLAVQRGAKQSEGACLGRSGQG